MGWLVSSIFQIPGNEAILIFPRIQLGCQAHWCVTRIYPSQLFMPLLSKAEEENSVSTFVKSL